MDIVQKRAEGRISSFLKWTLLLRRRREQKENSIKKTKQNVISSINIIINLAQRSEWWEKS